jgi:hypothetical protein
MRPIYFLVRYYPQHTSYIATGVSPLLLPDLHLYAIQRAYPTPSDHDLTIGLVRLQRIWRRRRALLRWAGHPSRLFYREQTGAFFPGVYSMLKTYRDE